MAVTKLYNKITLREHPDLSPTADPSFEKGHSFIFPGDELVFCTKITAPDDIGGSFAGINLISAKCSIIAKKPNIFSSQFNSTFASTRSFELDSFIVPLNNSNAPNVPWGTDGYAPNINFTQDRNWQLASGDFRRQINFFTKHTNSTTTWDWNFWYPVIFREEYWLALKNADNDFYDNTQPQNGKNQKWLRYHNPSAPPFGWIIMYRFELTYSQSGVQNTIYSELNLSHEQLGINDYLSNPDYTLKSIKSCEVGGTPINTPFAPIFGDKNTSVFAYFNKVAPWDGSEDSNLIAILRIRPMQSGDQSASNRGSEKYSVQNSDVWVAQSQHLKTNSGFRLKTNNGKLLTTNQNVGGGCTLSFDPSDHQKIIVYGEIDYQKLAVKYPGVQKFTLYCRLYNGTIYTA